jgi:hypothetical protein
MSPACPQRGVLMYLAYAKLCEETWRLKTEILLDDTPCVPVTRLDISTEFSAVIFRNKHEVLGLSGS